VWSFLLWLRTHNFLYSDITLDANILAQYPDDGHMPGIENCIITDNTLDPSSVFMNETAGISEHPAELMLASNKIQKDDDSPFIFLEKMGVSDPEGDKLSGCSFIASALRNLIPSYDANTSADLILHQSSQAVTEYNNPHLLPGMYPTLFPLGIGGTEDRTHPVALSFQKQVAYYLDLPGHAFRYHHSFIFVTLNIIQRRAAHLRTSFAV